jgi:predicted AAA+ superfamily ATPase
MLPLQSLILTLLTEFKEKISEAKDSVARRYTFSFVPNMINVAIGMRRVGKTFMLFQEIRRLLDAQIPIERILYLNLEDDRLLPANKSDLAELLDAFYTLYPDNHNHECYFFLDEIQNVDDWPIVVRRFLDSKKIRIYLTGSSSKLLSKEISTSLRGRSFAKEIWPYSFSEYLTAHQHEPMPQVLGKKDQDIYYGYLVDYLLQGGFPAIQQLQVEERRVILQDYVDTVVFRDIIERHHITNISLIKYLVKSLINLTACDFSPNKFYNDLKSKGFKVSKDTIYNYIQYIEDAFLSFSVPLYSESLRKTQVNRKKIYTVDSGLVNAYAMSFSNNFGRMFENLIYLDLRRAGDDIYYYQTKEGYSIDFYTRDLKGAFHLYQVVWDTNDQQTLARETRALQAAEQELGIKGELIDPLSYLDWSRDHKN